MKRGVIVKPNRKGQIVIPQAMRRALGIMQDTHLHMLQRGRGFYAYPIQEVIGEHSYENSYPAILRETKGKWKEGWEQIREKRKATELSASQKRKASW